MADRRQQLETMADLQDAVNQRISEDWRANNNPWYRAIWIEAGELMDHLTYKWWKSGAPDWPQVQLELVDIFHFGLSDLLQRGMSPAQIGADLAPLVGHEDTATDQDLDTTRASVERFTARVLVDKHFDATGFFDLCHQVGLGPGALYTLYVSKNVLNRFRQDKGYNDPDVTYVKVWDGREDNEHMTDAMDGLDATAADYADQLYRAMEGCYPG